MAVTGIDRHVLDVAVAADVSQKLLAAWNSHQTEHLLALMTEDVTCDDASWPKKMRGRADVREFLEAIWLAVPDLRFEFEDPIIDPTSVQIVHYWRATATHTGMWDPPGLAPTRRTVRFEGILLGELRDGKLCRVRVIYDLANILRQAGVLPAAGSRGERFMVAMANLRTRLRGR